MNRIPRISEAEWEIMNLIWDRAPITANQVMDALKNNTEWKPSTVKSLINRLLKKGVIGFRQEGKLYSYSPLFTKEQCVKEESRSFLNRVYGGNFKPMVAQFIQEEKLSSQDIAELKKLLEEKGNNV